MQSWRWSTEEASEVTTANDSDLRGDGGGDGGRSEGREVAKAEAEKDH